MDQDTMLMIRRILKNELDGKVLDLGDPEMAKMAGAALMFIDAVESYCAEGR